VYRVLIVEDEVLVRLGLKNSLPWNEYEMTVIADASNGNEAWDIYLREAPDLIITDLKMPIMSGMELIEKIREKDKQTKIVILTCLEEFELVRKALSFGVSDYIPKLTMTTKEIEQLLGKIRKELQEKSFSSRKSAYIDPDRIKENLIKDYMFRNRYTEQEFARMAQQSGLRFNHRRTVLCVMEIDHFSHLQAKYKDDKGSLIRMSMLNLLEEILDGYYRGDVVHDSGSKYLLLLSFEDMNSRVDINSTLSIIIEHIQKVMKTYFNTSGTFAVSSMQEGYSSLKRQYAECSELLEFKFFRGLGGIIFFGEKRPVLLPETVEKLQALPLKYRSLGESYMQNLQKRIDHFLTNKDYSRSRVQNIFIQWLQWPTFEGSLLEPSDYEWMLNCFERLEYCETMDEMVGLFDTFLHKSEQILSNQRKFSREVKNTITYIREHYEREISLQELAENTNMSANYLSSLFKRETDYAITEYINRYRIEHAKRMLLETNLKSYEVAEKIGFADHGYFSRMFKKMTGTSPTEYKKQLVTDWEGDNDEKKI